MIRYRIVVGLRNSALSEKLKMDPTLTLEKATAKAGQSEAIKKQQSLLLSDFQESSRKSVEYIEGVKPSKGLVGTCVKSSRKLKKPFGNGVELREHQHMGYNPSGQWKIS